MDSPVHAIRLGLGLFPEDRKAEGIIGELSVRENIALALQARQGLWPCISRAKQTIDIAAKQEIMNEILALAKKGMAVLFISSEMEEVVRLSDRIVVMRERTTVGELPGGSSDQAVYAMIAGQA